MFILKQIISIILFKQCFCFTPTLSSFSSSHKPFSTPSLPYFSSPSAFSSPPSPFPSYNPDSFFDFDYDPDAHYLENPYYECDDSFCLPYETDVRFEKESLIGGTKLVEIKTSWPDFKTSSAIEECTPSLEIKDFATVVFGCQISISSYYTINVNGYNYFVYKLVDICEFSKKGWLNEDGTIKVDELLTKYDELEGVSEEIYNILSNDGYGYGYGKKNTRKETSNRFQNSKNEKQGKESKRNRLDRIGWDYELDINEFFEATNLTSLPSLNDYEKLSKIHSVVRNGLETCIKSTLNSIDFKK